MFSDCCCHQQWRLQVAHPYTNERWEHPPKMPLLNTNSFRLVRQLEIKLMQQCAHDFVYVGRCHGLADALTSPETKMHEQSGSFRCFWFVPPCRVKGVVVWSPYRWIVMERMVADCYRSLCGRNALAFFVLTELPLQDWELTPWGKWSPSIVSPSGAVTLRASGILKTGVSRKFSLTQSRR